MRTNRQSSRPHGTAAPHVDALAGHVTEFAKMLTGRHGELLDDWIAAVEADDQPDLHSFATGIKRENKYM